MLCVLRKDVGGGFWCTPQLRMNTTSFLSWLLQMSVVVDLPKDNIPLCATLRTWSEVRGNLYIRFLQDLRTFWWTPVNVCGTVWFMGCTPSDFPVDWRVNEVEVCPSSLCINQIEISCAKRLLHALHLLIRRVWWGSGSWQSLWSCDCPFRCGIEHWMPCESCKPSCGLWGPLLDPWEHFPRREDASKAGRPQCNGFKSEIALNWTLGLIPVHEHGSWRGYKNTGSLFLGEGGGCQCLRMSCLHNSRSLPCGGLAQTCDVWIKITHSLGVVWFSGSV